MAMAALVTEIDEQRDVEDNLSSAARIHVLEWFRKDD